MISSLAWVPAGVASATPQKYEWNTNEKELIDLLEKQGNLEELQQSKNTPGVKSKKKKKKDNDDGDDDDAPAHNLPADLRMDEYSSDEDDDDDGGQTALASRLMGGTDSDHMDEIEGETMKDNENDKEEGENEEKMAENTDSNDDDDDHDSDSDDDLADVPDTREFVPVNVAGLEAMRLGQGDAGILGMGGGGNNKNDEDDDDLSEQEDVRITPDDAVVCVAKTEEDFATLEVQVYDTKRGNLYVHHDIPLPAFPLCLAHGQLTEGGRRGNFCAVGLFTPGIEIWNLDVLNALEPSTVLGGPDTTSVDELLRAQLVPGASQTNIDNNSSKGGELRPGSHTDAVMALDWNPHHEHVLASGSADHTVKLWDVTTENGSSPASTHTHHKDKVAALAWHPREGTLLATAGYDRRLCLVDARTQTDNPKAAVKHVSLTADPEAIAWDPHRPELLTSLTEDNVISCWDVRQYTKPVWKLPAAGQKASGNPSTSLHDLSYHPVVPGLMVTAGSDQHLTLWDAHPTTTDKAGLKVCSRRDMCAGKLYACGFYPHAEPWLVGCGGTGNQLSLWDLSSEEKLQAHFRRDPMATPLPEATAPGTEEEEEEAVAENTVTTNNNNNKKKKKGKKKAGKKPHKRGGR